MIAVRIRKEFGERAVPPLPESEAVDDRRAGFTLEAEFNAPAGITILFGASGSGKTSTIKAIAGIIRPDSGLIRLNDQTLFDSERRIDMPIRERGVGLVFQNLALFPHMTALGNVEFAANGLARHERRRRALELMERLRISHTAPRRPRDISGGEAQRVALARALASRPRLLLLDEPLSAIDDATKQEIISDLKMINKDLRLPVIYVTHNRDEAVSLGDYLVAYDGGRVAALGEPLEILGGAVSARVARITGVENIFDGVVVKRDSAAGTMTVEARDRSGTCHLEIPLGRESEGKLVRVAIRSGDILIATEELHRTSARNILPGHITAIEERGAQSIVKIQSGIAWTASVTRQAVKELGLAPGQKIWMAIKTHSCYLLEAQ
ncbi:MAG TPA: molybdenum ABC transporter ATP-binding protein [Pyrinomonadaceae bacterium]|nr:molybdenum ABC transporter ATP-binding protein [Pyrinomonadaceae bacterium]